VNDGGLRLHPDRLKRAFDALAATFLMIVLAPALVVLAAIVRLDTPGPALFTQTRIGRGGRPFTLYKFRTFHVREFGIFPGEEIRPGDPRVTPAGHFLRRAKLDELPQLLNVLLGDMSLVGPRPDIPIQVADYTPQDRERLRVRPGLTGLAQVSGNVWLPWPDRIALDRWYVRRRSNALDLRILVATLPLLLRGERAEDDPLGVRAEIFPESGPDRIA